MSAHLSFLKAQFCHLIMYLSSFSLCADYLFNEYAFYIFIVKLHWWKDCWSQVRKLYAAP